MEVAEEASLEAAIGWLVQTILATLLIGKLDAWIRQAGLADHVERLKSEVERVEMVAAAVSGRGINNKPLARSLARLKELLYDADDAVDELDYYRLQQQVEGVTYDDPESMQGAEHLELDERSRGGAAEMPSSKGGNLRSKCWKEFEVTKWENGKAVEAKCIRCDAPPIKCGSKNGTSVLSNHLKSKGCTRKRKATDLPPNPSSTGDDTANATPMVIGNSSSRKRRRAQEESAQITAVNTHTPWDKAELSNRIQEITSQLQDIQAVVSEVLKIHGSDSATCSNHYRGTTSDQYLRTSSVVQRKVYGRVAEKNSILKLMAEDRSDSVTVLPIVGIGGVGKTALAQLVYNDPDVESQFEHRIWVWVSHNFDEVRLTREMLDFVSRKRHEGSPQTIERYEGISSFAKLQEIFKGHMEFLSKRFLLIFDDVWDNMDDYRWNKLLAPLKSSRAKGNVILVTTRSFSVARRTGTVESIKLRALANKDFWLLCKAYAFRDENYEGHPSLSIVGRQIAEKLKGNPLAAETAGALLRENLTIDHWSNILMNEDWKSLQLSRGIMPALKLSYDQLPYHLQQCLSFSSIFPYNHQFLGDDLVHMWISQGFVKCNNSSKRLEEIGQYYLNDLVNLGFFQQVEEEDDDDKEEEEEEEEESSLGSQIWYSLCSLMHDFARMVSWNECATIDGLQCNKMLPTIRHLSILTDSAYNKDQHGNIPRNKKFEENLRNTVTSVRKLRTLVLLGHYDSFFFQLFQDIFQKAQNLRLVQMSAKSADFNSFQCSLANPAHVRYLKHASDEVDGALPQVLSKLFHLQVLDLGSNTNPTVPNGMNDLVSLRHLVAGKGVYSSISSIGNMTSLQELHDFKVQVSSGFEITQLQSMNQLVQLEVSQLHNVKTREEAYGAGLRNKEHLEKLHLSWKLLPMDDSGPSSEPSIDTARDVLESLEPHPDLKHLEISGYNGTTGPTWLASNVSVSSLQTLHLDRCGKWQVLPSLEKLPFLTKLKLINMRTVKEVWVPSLEDLVLVKMPKLERCSCTSVGGLNSSLRALQIEKCHALKVFDLFENDYKFEMEQNTAREDSSSGNPDDALIGLAPDGVLHIPLNPTSSLKKITVDSCPLLKFEGFKGGLSGFTALEKLVIAGCPEVLPSLVHIGGNDDQANGRWLLPQSLVQLVIHDDSLETLQPCFPRNLTCLKKLQVWHNTILESLQLHSCTALEELAISGCESLAALEGLQSLGSLTRLEVSRSSSLESLRLHSCTALEELAITECKSLAALEGLQSLGSLTRLEVCRSSSLESLQLHSCTALEKLAIWYCKSLAALEGLQSLGSLTHLEVCGSSSLESLQLHSCTALEELAITECKSLAALEGLQSFGSLTRLEVSGSSSLESLQLHSCTALEELAIWDCESLAALEGLQSLGSLTRLEVRGSSSLESLQLHSCTALEKLAIWYCESLAALEGLQSLGSLTRLEVRGSSSLESLQLHSCTALEELVIWDCKSLAALEGLQSLGSLTRLEVRGSSSLESLQLHSCTALKELAISDCESLAALEGLQSLGSLTRLEVRGSSSLESLQLHSCTALEKLAIWYCESLAALEGLQSLGSLTRLKVYVCSSLESLQLHSCTALEKLVIWDCKSLAALEGLQSLGSLTRLEVSECSSLESLQLHSCTALEELAISDCELLAALEGLQSLGSLTRLEVRGSSSLESLQLHSCTALKELAISDCESLAALEGLQSLGSLTRLEVSGSSSLESLQLHSCTALEELAIWDCESLAALEGLQSLGSLTRLEVSRSSSLESLRLHSCTALEELAITECKSLAALEGLQSLGSLTRLEVRGSSSLESLQLHSCTALKELAISDCESLAALEGLQSLGSLTRLEVRGSSSLESLQLHSCTALEKLAIWYCESLAALEGLQSLGSLTRLEVRGSSSLESLQLHSCTALEELVIWDCKSLAALEGLQSLGSLTRLTVFVCSSLEFLQLHSCTALEELAISDCESLAALEGLQSLGSLTRLKVYVCSSLESLQLHSCTALEELTIWGCESLAALEGLQSLGSLTRLVVFHCPGLPETVLPPSLEELEIVCCSKELADQCRLLATSKLNVKIT